MKYLVLTLILILEFGINIYSQSPDWAWVRNSGNVSGRQVTTDGKGSVYVTCSFTDSINLNSISIVDCSLGQNLNFAIAKYDTLGNIQWAETFCGKIYSAANVECITTDDSGNVYICGSFDGDSLTFGNFTLKNRDYTFRNMFIVKFAPNGNTLWAKGIDQHSLTGYSSANKIAFDLNGNFYVTGIFSQNLLIIEGDSMFNPTFTYKSDIFILKYNYLGTLIWAKSFGGNDYDEATSLTTNGNDFYLTGYFQSKIFSLGSTVLINADSNGLVQNNFIAKLDSSGNFIWARGNSTNGNSRGIDISSDQNGNIYAIGNYFSPNIIFGNDTLTYPPNWSNFSAFIVAYDSGGNLRWARNIGIGTTVSVNSISINSNGDINVIGGYGDYLLWMDSTKLISEDGGMYIAQFNNNGSVNWAKSLSKYGIGSSITSENNSIYILGTCNRNSLVFGNMVINYNLGIGQGFLYFAKLDGQCLGVSLLQQSQSQTIFSGDSAIFAVTPGAGQPLIYYNWFMNGLEIQGANDSSFTCYPNNSAYNGAIFYCIISNCDYSNSIQSANDTLTIIDTIPPVITLNGLPTIYQILNNSYIDAGATAFDNVDLNITANISSNLNSTNPDVNLTGSYTITYSVMDAAGNSASATRTVIVYNEVQLLQCNSYNVDDSCLVINNSQYIGSVYYSQVFNKNILIQNFGAFGSGVIVDALVGNWGGVGSTITCNTQSLGGSAVLLNGFGMITSLSPISFYIGYKWTDSVSQDSCISYYVSHCFTSVEEINIDHIIKVSPNPTSGLLNVIDIKSQSLNYNIYNLLGQILFSGQINSNENTIDLQNQPQGIYFIRFLTNVGLVTKKIMVVK